MSVKSCHTRVRHRIRGTFAVATVALAVFSSQAFVSAKSTPAVTGRAEHDEQAWTMEAWTGDSKPYEKIRKEIDHSVASGEKILSLVAKYETSAKQRPEDPQAQFAWAYAVYQVAAARQTPYGVGYGMLVEPRKALADAKSPHAYEYDRLRFLINAFGPEYKSQLKLLGRRLLKKKPDDAKIKRLLAYILVGSSNPAEQQQALTYAQELARVDPTTLAVYSVPAALYMCRWLRRRDHEDAVKARMYYQQWLQHAPPDDAFRQTVAVHLRTLQNK